MNCLVCKTNKLEEETNESGLKACSCSECKGMWIRFDDYLTWKSKDENDLLFQFDTSTTSESNDYMPEYDSKKANQCPD